MATTLPAPSYADDEFAERQRLILRHLPLARRLARRYAHSRDSQEELDQVASLGLIKAIDRYEPERGVSLTSFAVPTILGELKRHFRDTRWALHVPRDLQERAQRVEAELDRLTSELGRAPTRAELADAVGVSVEEVVEAREAFSGYDAASLDAPAFGADDADDAATTGDMIAVDERGYALAEEWAALAPALAELSERDRLALRLRFFEDMTQSQIAARLGVSQMHVSRILRAALDSLRAAAQTPPA
jgi:RNA polymerase sigma-B factor